MSILPIRTILHKRNTYWFDIYRRLLVARNAQNQLDRLPNGDVRKVQSGPPYAILKTSARSRYGISLFPQAIDAFTNTCLKLLGNPLQQHLDCSPFSFDIGEYGLTISVGEKTSLIIPTSAFACFAGDLNACRQKINEMIVFDEHIEMQEIEAEYARKQAIEEKAFEESAELYEDELDAAIEEESELAVRTHEKRAKATKAKPKEAGV